ncbi:MAG: acyl-CoA dehydrogenase family protein [Desulfobacterales bacterium]
MDFGLDKEQEMLRKSFSEFLSKEVPFDTVREIKASETGYSGAIWKKMAQLGWLGMTFEEQYGGMQGSFMDVFLLFEEIGKVLLPSPLLFGNVLPGMVLQEAGSEDLKSKCLPLLVDGGLIIASALFDENGKIDTHAPAVSAEKASGGGYQVNGVRLLVPYAPYAGKMMLCADVKENAAGPTLMLVDTGSPGVTVTPVNTITDEKSYAVAFDNVPAAEDHIIGGPGRGNEILEGIINRAAVLKCAEMIGGLRRVLEMTVAYAKDRHQFGRPIGSFQAVQHYCADMAIFLDGASLIAYSAASLISHGKPCTREAAMAKAWCSDAYKQSTWMSQQIHGGMGFTEEFNIQLFYKHAKESELLFGHAKQNRCRVADEVGF